MKRCKQVKEQQPCGQGTLYINGKFLAQRTTGVQRFARGVVTALDRSLQARPTDRDIVLLLPPFAEPIVGLRTIQQRRIGRPGRSLLFWEQATLPLEARKGTLLCLSGSAPIFASKCVPTIHDAAVYLHPKAYSRAFIAWYRLLFYHRARRAPFVLTVSQSSARDLAAQLTGATFRVVPNSAEHIASVDADSDVLTALRLDPRCYLLAVGSLNPTKNFATLIRAYAKSVLSSRIPLVIVGAVNSSVFRTDDAFIDHPNVRWVGPVSDAQLRTLYEQAATFVFPSIYEGFGIPPLEAMHCGCPVIASNASSIPEVCGDAAVYVDPLDGNAMMTAIESLLDNPSRRKTLIERGHLRSQAFTWDVAAERLRQALADCRIITR
jgi:glycosyltransferase involved in cell wall biosynthesis